MKYLRWPFAVLWTVYVATPMRMLGADTGAPPPWRYAMWRLTHR